jgi:hypothetical protein
MFPNMTPMSLRLEQQQREKELTLGTLSSLNDSVRAELEARQFEEAEFSAKNGQPTRSFNVRWLFRRLVSPRLQHNLK